MIIPLVTQTWEVPSVLESLLSTLTQPISQLLSPITGFIHLFAHKLLSLGEPGPLPPRHISSITCSYFPFIQSLSVPMYVIYYCYIHLPWSHPSIKATSIMLESNSTKSSCHSCILTPTSNFCMHMSYLNCPRLLNCLSIINLSPMFTRPLQSL